MMLPGVVSSAATSASNRILSRLLQRRISCHVRKGYFLSTERTSCYCTTSHLTSFSLRPSVLHPLRHISSTSNSTNPRFDPNRSYQEWSALTNELLEDTAELETLHHLALYEETIRWWTTQRTAQSVDYALMLIERVTGALAMDDESRRKEVQLLRDHWYRGSYPRSTHLLNAILDEWRIVVEKGATIDEKTQGSRRKSALLTPSQLLARIEAMAEEGMPLEARSYSSLMLAAVRGALPISDAPEFCEQVLERALERANQQEKLQTPAETNDLSLVPDAVAWTIAIKAWANVSKSNRRPVSAQRALALFQRVTTEPTICKHGPSTVLFNTLLECLVPVSLPNSENDPFYYMNTADEVLRSMAGSPFPHVQPTDVSYRIVLFAWCDQAARWWLLLRKQEKDNRKRGRSDRTVDTSEASALAQYAIDKAWSLLQDSVMQYADGSPIMDSSFYSKLLTTIVQDAPLFSEPQHIGLAETIFQHQQDQFEKTGNDRFAPTARTSRALLTLLCKSGRPAEAQAFLDQMEQQYAATPSRSEWLLKRGHYRDVFFAWLATLPPTPHTMQLSLAEEEAHLPAIRNAIQLVHRMLALDRSYCPDPHMLYSFLRTASRNSLVPPNDLEEVLRGSVKQGMDCQPSVMSPVFFAWSHHHSNHTLSEGTALDRVWQLIQDMQEWFAGKRLLDRSHLTAGIVALSRCAETDNEKTTAGLRAVQVLDMAIQEVRSSGSTLTRPDSGMYNVVLYALVQSGNGHQADTVFRFMMKDFYERGNMDARPTVKSLNRVLAAWLASNHPEAGQKVRALLRDVHKVTNETRNAQNKLLPNRETHRMIEQLTGKDYFQAKTKECH